jgi:hypothetical protein
MECVSSLVIIFGSVGVAVNYPTHLPSVFTGTGIPHFAPAWIIEEKCFDSRQEKEIFLSEVSRSILGVHPTSYSVGRGDSYPRDKADPSPPNADDKNEWIYTSSPPYVFMARTSRTWHRCFYFLILFTILTQMLNELYQ